MSVYYGSYYGLHKLYGLKSLNLNISGTSNQMVMILSFTVTAHFTHPHFHTEPFGTEVSCILRRHHHSASHIHQLTGTLINDSEDV